MKPLPCGSRRSCDANVKDESNPRRMEWEATANRAISRVMLMRSASESEACAQTHVPQQDPQCVHQNRGSLVHRYACLFLLFRRSSGAYVTYASTRGLEHGFPVRITSFTRPHAATAP